MTIQNITGLIPTSQALNLTVHNIPKKGKKVKIVKNSITNIVGLSLIRETTAFANSL